MLVLSSLEILVINDHAIFGSGVMLRAGIVNVEMFETGSLTESMCSAFKALAVVLQNVQFQGLNGLELIALSQRKWQ